MREIVFPNQTSFIAFIVFIVLFSIVSIFNLVAGFYEKEKLRKLSKPFCLLFLGIAAALASPSSYLIYIGAFMGGIGDLLLIWKEKKTLLLSGLISFLIGHMCYIAEGLVFLYKQGALIPIQFLYLALAYLAIWLLAIYPVYRATKKNIVFTIGGSFYASILISVLATSILGTSLGYADYFGLMVGGAILFIVSDITLTYTIFTHDIKRRDFYIMLTYLLGQVGIVLGLLFTVLR